jgi:hypothetical protein
MLFAHPFTRIKHLQDAKMYAEGTARDYLNRLTEKTHKKSRIISNAASKKTIYSKQIKNILFYTPYSYGFSVIAFVILIFNFFTN